MRQTLTNLLVHGVGNMIGVGKESDVYVCSDENDEPQV